MRSNISGRFLDKRYKVRVTRDVVYGYGKVGYSGGRPTTRPLHLDVYEPVGGSVDRSDELCPALLLAFGGAFHRGSKENDEFNENGHRNTPVAQYCESFARRGYVAFSVEYRLIPEDPDPGVTTVVGLKEHIPRSRVDGIRQLLGLPVATTEMLWRGIEAASDDLATAFDFVCDNAPNWRICPQRVAVGGFSAGARTALNAVYAEKRPAAAVVSLSGHMASDDLARHIGADCHGPPAMLVVGERDLDYVQNNTPTVEQYLRAVGIPCEMHVIMGATHFYPASSSIVQTNGVVVTLEEVISDFLYRSLHLDEKPTRPSDV